MAHDSLNPFLFRDDGFVGNCQRRVDLEGTERIDEQARNSFRSPLPVLGSPPRRQGELTCCPRSDRFTALRRPPQAGHGHHEEERRLIGSEARSSRGLSRMWGDEGLSRGEGRIHAGQSEFR